MPFLDLLKLAAPTSHYSSAEFKQVLDEKAMTWLTTNKKKFTAVDYARHPEGGEYPVDVVMEEEMLVAFALSVLKEREDKYIDALRNAGLKVEYPESVLGGIRNLAQVAVSRKVEP